MRGRNAPVSSCTASTLRRTTSISSRGRARGSGRGCRSPRCCRRRRPRARRPAACRRASGARRVAEVAGLDVDVDAVGLAQLVGELLEAVAAACGQRDVVAALGELAREVGADPGGRAGDQDGRAVRGGRESHASILTLVELWTHDRWRFPLPQRHRFPIAKYPLLRRRIVELGLATPEEIHETEPVAVGAARARPRRRAAAAHPRRRAERARAARARPAVVARAGRARPPRGRGHASRRRATRSRTASR